MKHLSEYINEGVFGDNIKSAIKINGVEIYEPDWKLCEEYYKKRRKRYFWNKTSVSLGDMLTDHEVIYSGDDCLICLNKEEDYNEVYVLSPETIYMNHQISEICDGRQYTFSITNVDDANDYNIAFVYYGDNDTWGWLEGCHSGFGRKTAMEEFGINRGYLPVTISNKAKDIIKKYMKS